MQNYIPDNVTQAILFEQPLRIEDMTEVCEIYNVPKEKIYIQLQHRTNKDYINNIKNKLCKRIIATIGLFQKDFEEYFWELHNILDDKTDCILLDFSKHQPDLIRNFKEYKEDLDKILILKSLAKLIKNNKVPIIIADDTDVTTMKKYLNILLKNDIKVKGIDMQNAVEIKTNEQRYQIIECNKKSYQVKIRKSPNKMYEWRSFEKELLKGRYYE